VKNRPAHRDLISVLRKYGPLPRLPPPTRATSTSGETPPAAARAWAWHDGRTSRALQVVTF